MKKLIVCSVLLGLGIACGSSDATPAAPPPPVPVAPATQPSAVVPAVAEPVADLTPPSPDELPIPADFEAEAETAITRQSYKKALAEIDREIEADSAR